MDDSATNRDGHRLCSVARSEFSHNVLDMDLDSLFCNKELFADVAIAVSFGDLPENFDFAAGQRLHHSCAPRVALQVAEGRFFSRMNLANHLHQLFRGHAFQQVRTRTSLQSALYFNVTFKGRQHNDARFGKFGPDRDQGLDPAFVGKARSIRVISGWCLRYCSIASFAGGSIRDNAHVLLAVNHCGDTFPQQWMIVHTQNSNLAPTSSELLTLACRIAFALLFFE